MASSRSCRRATDDDVVCIACGDTVPRLDAREYDKYGDRWERDGKTFEYLCKPCHRECCHQPRDELEATLVKADAGDTDQASFLRNYQQLIADSHRSES